MLFDVVLRSGRSYLRMESVGKGWSNGWVASCLYEYSESLKLNSFDLIELEN